MNPNPNLVQLEDGEVGHPPAEVGRRGQLVAWLGIEPGLGSGVDQG